MSKHFLWAVIAILAAFCTYEVWLNYHLRDVNDSILEQCVPTPVVQQQEVTV